MWFFGRTDLKISPRKNVGVRLEAIGGQGAHSAGKILAEIAVIGSGHTGNHFSSFGSEKRGAPVKSFVRFSPERKEIRSASAIREPDLLVVFHEYLIETHPEVLDGVGPQTDLLVHSRRNPHEISLPLQARPRWLGTIDAARIAERTGSGLNAAVLGATIPFLPELSAAAFETVIERFFPSADGKRRASNLRALRGGRDEVKVKLAYPGQSKFAPPISTIPRFGYENAPFGGAILNPGSSILKSHEASRNGFAPRFSREVCFDCGYCDMVCPDYCFVWEPASTERGGRLLGIDYQFCKGCQKCIQVCPVEALKLSPEEDIPLEERIKKFVPKGGDDGA